MTEIAVRRRLAVTGRLRIDGPASVAGAVVLVVVAVAALAPLIAPYDPSTGNLAETLAAPSWDHIFGTDSSGRDVFSRLLYGARTSLVGPMIILVASTLLGGAMGLMAGYVGGVLDTVLTRTWDLILSFPSLILAILLVAAIGPGYWGAVGALAFLYSPILARVVRSAVLGERGKPYVEAARLQGFPTRRILVRHLLPNIIPPIAAQATLNFGYCLLELAGLTYLGLGVQPPTADWGQMLLSGRESLPYGSYAEAIAASVVIVVTVVSFNVLGDALARRGRSRS